MPHIATSTAESLSLKYYGLKGSAEALPGEWGGVFKVVTREGKKFCLKILPDHVPSGFIQRENTVLKHLQAMRLQLAFPVLVPAENGHHQVSTKYGEMRLFEWVEGRLWKDVNPKSPELLASLGSALGRLSKVLRHLDVNHSAWEESRSFQWAPHSATWVRDHRDMFEGERRDLFDHFLDLLERKTVPAVSGLRCALNYNDANDHNIIVSEDALSPVVTGFIDFGDVAPGPLVNDLAICLAYAMMDHPDPLSAGQQVVKAYHRECPLSEDELYVLFGLTVGRLLISVTKAAQRALEDPGNAYWQVSAQQAWQLFARLRYMPAELAHCRFRAACGFEPSPKARAIRSWLKDHNEQFHNVVDVDLRKAPLKVFDWSVGSPEASPDDESTDLARASRQTFGELRQEGMVAGIGRYNEARLVYTADHYAIPGNHGPEWRTIHLGLDVFMEAGTSLYAPVDGTVYTNCKDKGVKGYGHLLILEHRVRDDLTFFTLYGHNSASTLDLIAPGETVRKGQKIAEIGDHTENGGWIPHLHFQVIADMLDYTDDFPGVAIPAQRKTWLSLCPDPNLILGIDNAAVQVQEPENLLEHRQSLIGPNVKLSYPTPLNIVRGRRTTLYTHEGVGYLDTCNNVAHVGHEHPRVVRAGQEQMAVLNTNTRYLHEAIVDTAEILLETLPSNLTHIYFVNSGSEANDLALRIARTYTDSQETVVLDEAYHGHTRACLEVSPYKFQGPGGFEKPEHILILPLPATYGERLKHGPDAGGRITRDACHRIDETLDSGPKVLIHESLPSCAGQIVPPPDYFREVYKRIHASGGVCIADEVQTGLGRVGDAFWAFGLYGVQPDIVTIGKPLGNGHPVAAVALTRELAMAFDNGMEFFSSFGGNPVSCAVAGEVVRVVRDEGLQDHARELGAYWRNALLALQGNHPVIGDVRGHGLFLGVEFVQPETMKPAGEKAGYLQRRMYDFRILTSIDGRHRNVLKIKPPLCIDEDEVEYFMEVMERICREDAMT